MLRSLFLLICATLIFSGNLIAQAGQEPTSADSTSKSFNIISGYNYSSSHMVELGASYRKFYVRGYHAYEDNVSLSAEIMLGKELVIGPKISGWIAGGMAGVAMGITLINYTNINQNELNVRPEIGLGLFGVKVVYGYNIKVLGKGFDEISKSSISLTFPLYSMTKSASTRTCR